MKKADAYIDTISNCRSLYDIELSLIYAKIQDAINNGEFSIKLDSMPDSVIKVLSYDGYCVETNVQYLVHKQRVENNKNNPYANSPSEAPCKYIVYWND